ncbi:MAG: NAD-dependent epimerase/dehydratase family protein [Nitrososphaerales archaeon]|nr:NAD-dependent epimerase/dehydratase family protein [Nitrososphaerales archaeon]
MGGHVVEYLFQQNEISKGIFRKGAHLKTMDLNGVQGIEADLLDHHSLHEAMEGVDTIYSMASPMPGYDTDFEKINTEGVANLLEVAQEAKVKTLVHLSALDVYGFRSPNVTAKSEPEPAGEYQRSKLQADRTLLEFAKRSRSPRVVIIRPAKAVGSRDQSFTIPLLSMIEAGSATLPLSGEMSFSHPRDIAEAMFKAAGNLGLTRSIYLLKSFDASPEALASGIAAALDKQARIRRESILAKSPLPAYTKEQLRGRLRMDTQESWTELGYLPKFDLQKTCQEVAEWYKKDPWAIEQA